METEPFPGATFTLQKHANLYLVQEGSGKPRTAARRAKKRSKRQEFKRSLRQYNCRSYREYLAYEGED